MDFLVRQFLVILGFLLAVILVARLLREHRPPGNTMAWVLAILLIPYVGVPLYLIFGGRKIKRLEQHREPIALETPDEGPFGSDTEKILCATGIPRARAHNRLTMIDSGDEAYRQLVRLIDGAKTSLDFATFILAKDKVGTDILERLTRRAEEGIKVRLLLDALGSFWATGSFLKPLRQAGGEVGVFLPMLPFRRKWSANLRNHRKIWIADQEVAMIGGRNIGSEYLGHDPNSQSWADYNVLVEGPAVADLMDVFASDWEFATRKPLKIREPAPAFFPGSTCQVVAAGPDTTTNALYQGVLTSILNAKHRVWIATPYFIPDEILMQALMLTAKLGRDVRVIVPAKSNHRLADFARGSYLRGLCPSGVQCYEYQSGMSHTKLLVIDDDLAVVGSANVDMRSMYLNFEIGVFIYDKEKVAETAAYILSMYEQSLPFDFAHGTWGQAARVWAEDISRLFAPLL